MTTRIKWLCSSIFITIDLSNRLFSFSVTPFFPTFFLKLHSINSPSKDKTDTDLPMNLVRLVSVKIYYGRRRHATEGWLVTKEKRKKKKPYYRKAGSRASPFLLDDATPRLEEIAAEFSWTSNTVNGCRLVVVIPIVWESCVWLRPVGVVSIASCSIQQNESPVCVGVFLSYRVFSLAIFRCAV